MNCSSGKASASPKWSFDSILPLALALFYCLLSLSFFLSLFGLTLAVHSGIFSRTSCGIVVWLLPFDCAHNKNWHIFLVSMRLLLLCSVFTFHNCRAQWKFTKKTTRNPKTNGENSKWSGWERERECARERGGYNCVAVAKANAGKVFHFFVPCRWKPVEVVLQFSRDYKWIKRLSRNPFKNCNFLT